MREEREREKGGRDCLFPSLFRGGLPAVHAHTLSFLFPLSESVGTAKTGAGLGVRGGGGIFSEGPFRVHVGRRVTDDAKEKGEADFQVSGCVLVCMYVCGKEGETWAAKSYCVQQRRPSSKGERATTTTEAEAELKKGVRVMVDGAMVVCLALVGSAEAGAEAQRDREGVRGF